MDCIRSRRVLVAACAAAVFSLSWAAAASSWGAVGVYAGWIPAAILAAVAAGTAWILWIVVALTMLLGWHCHARDGGEALG